MPFSSAAHHEHALRVMCVVAARPNMMKVAPIMAEMRRAGGFDPVLVHTGQHYDYAMSQVFFEQLQMPNADHDLEVGSGSHHEQTAEIIKRFGKLVTAERPDCIVVAGDVNSTMACALVAAKERIPLAHVEAGLRSGDRSMPEEINRIVTDALSEREGVDAQKVVFTGNVMMDSLRRALELPERSNILEKVGLLERKYLLITLHRPSNVDDPAQLKATLQQIAVLAKEMPAVFPVHPRTAAKVKELGIPGLSAWQDGERVGGSGTWLMEPAPYLDFVELQRAAALVITDSGGVQEETTYLGVPCLTYRENTERPVTISRGTNRLIGAKPERIVPEARAALQETRVSGAMRPPLWDGHAAERIVDALRKFVLSKRAESGDRSQMLFTIHLLP